MSKINIIMYHYVRDLKGSRYPDIKGLDYKDFKEQVKWLKNNFRIIRIEDVIAAYDGQCRLPDNAALLSFDDGYIDNYEYVFPILDKEKIQGTFYITGKTLREHILLDVNKIHFILASAPIESILKDVIEQIDKYRTEYSLESADDLFKQYAIPNRFDSKETIFVKRILQTVLPENIRNEISSRLFEKYVGVPEEVFAKELYVNEDQLLCMKNNGMHIGLHGYDHYWLGRLSEEKMQEDIDKSIEAMKSIVDSDEWVFNYPYGSYNDAVIEHLKRRGCKLAMTTDVRVADTEQDDRYLLPRLDTNDYPPKSNTYLNIQ